MPYSSLICFPPWISALKRVKSYQIPILKKAKWISFSPIFHRICPKHLRTIYSNFHKIVSSSHYEVVIPWIFPYPQCSRRFFTSLGRCSTRSFRIMKFQFPLKSSIKILRHSQTCIYIPYPKLHPHDNQYISTIPSLLAKSSNPQLEKPLGEQRISQSYKPQSTHKGLTAAQLDDSSYSWWLSQCAVPFGSFHPLTFPCWWNPIKNQACPLIISIHIPWYPILIPKYSAILEQTYKTMWYFHQTSIFGKFFPDHIPILDGLNHVKSKLLRVDSHVKPQMKPWISSY